jgi:hypothetical protein
VQLDEPAVTAPVPDAEAAPSPEESREVSGLRLLIEFALIELAWLAGLAGLVLLARTLIAG